MMTMEQILHFGADTLQKAGVLEPRLDAWYLLSYCMGITKTQYYMHSHEEVNKQYSDRYSKLLERRVKREPLQYIIGEQEFMGLVFTVDENVLIPRQDTELLVELVIKHAQGKSILDMCTGSGCIAVSLACLSEAEKVDASDISEDALCVAKTNAERNNAEVKFIQSNLWENVKGKYDILVSNPPYIDDEEMKDLMPEVKDYEPKLALSGGFDGLDYYRRIMRNIQDKIYNRGLIFFEIGCGQGKDVAELLLKYNLVDVKIEKDLAGLDRVVWGKMK